MADLLLTHGYFLYEDENERTIMRPYPPLGLLYLSSHLKAKGFDVDLFDSTLDTWEAWQAHLRATRPPVVGIYVNLLTRARVLQMIALAKAQGAFVVLGGPEPANYAAEYLAHGADICVLGEGELTLEALLPHLAHHGLSRLSEVDGLAYLDGDGTLTQSPPRTQIPDLDAQPFPDRAAIDLPAYIDVWRRHHGQGAVSLITARGCPYKCHWCSHAVFGYTHRRRSPENVVAEVETIVERYNPELLWYADDVFTIHHRWLFNYAAALKQRGLRLPFETISREDRLNEDVVKTLAEMGCYRIWIGAESGSQRILDRMERRTNAARVVEMVQLLQRYGIEAGMFIMLGYDGEEMVDLEATVDRLKAASPDIFLTTIAYPIKGTKYHDAVADRVVPLTEWARGSDRLQTVAGRRSRRFYGHATRWMVHEVELHRRRSGGAAPWHLVRPFMAGRLGRLGMHWTRNEIETGLASPVAPSRSDAIAGDSNTGNSTTAP